VQSGGIREVSTNLPGPGQLFFLDCAHGADLEPIAHTALDALIPIDVRHSVIEADGADRAMQNALATADARIFVDSHTFSTP
jgi:hypothetical protein